jgi:hypothetical protein
MANHTQITAKSLRPRLAMGIAVTILSFEAMARSAAAPVLNPVRIWTASESKITRAKDQAMKYYENLRLVFQMERECELRHLREGQRSRVGEGKPVRI